MKIANYQKLRIYYNSYTAIELRPPPSMLREIYRTHIHAPALDRGIYRVLDGLTNAYAAVKGYSFPRNYIRRWKLDMLFERYEKETVALFRKTVTPGMTVVDIGAHIGYYTRIAAKLVGRKGAVYGFEADPENFSLLKKNTSRFKNSELVPFAIADKEGVIDFYHYDDKSGAHSTLQNVPLPFQKRKIAVNAVSLDRWLQKRGITRVDIIKMDIEGGESAALSGMRETLKRTHALFTEFAPAWIEAAGSTPREFLQTIESHGFTIHAITPLGRVILSPIADERYAALLPKSKDGSHASEFINLYCVK